MVIQLLNGVAILSGFTGASKTYIWRYVRMPGTWCKIDKEGMVFVGGRSANEGGRAREFMGYNLRSRWAGGKARDGDLSPPLF